MCSQWCPATFSACLCTIEGNTGTTAASGTTPDTATTGCARCVLLSRHEELGLCMYGRSLGQ